MHVGVCVHPDDLEVFVFLQRGEDGGARDRVVTTEEKWSVERVAKLVEA